MKIVLNNQKELPVLWVEEGPEYYDNANRRVLTVQAAHGAVSLDVLDGWLSSPGNLEPLKVMDEETGATDIFDHYCIKMELGKKTVPAGEAADGMPITEERIQFKLGRYTPIELKLMQLELL